MVLSTGHPVSMEVTLLHVWKSALRLDRGAPSSKDAAELVGSGPGGATFSRARLRLDAMLMMSRRKHWEENGFDKHWIALGYLPAAARCFGVNRCSELQVRWLPLLRLRCIGKTEGLFADTGVQCQAQQYGRDRGKVCLRMCTLSV